MSFICASLRCNFNLLAYPVQGLTALLRVTGELPDGLGTYRFSFPWFDLDAGPCLHYLEFEEKDGAMLLTGQSDSGGTVGQAPWCPLTMSWFGVEADHSLDQLKEYRCPGVVDIDWTSEAAGRIEVSRNRIQPREAAALAIEGVIRELKEQIRAFSREHSDSRFALYNAAVSEAEPPPVEDWYWLCQHETEPRFEWRPLGFPAVASAQGDNNALMATSAYQSALRTVKRFFPDAPEVQQKERSAIPIDEYQSSQQALSRYCGVNVSTQPPSQSPAGDELFTRGWSRSTTWYSPNLAPTRVVAIVHRNRMPWGFLQARQVGLLWDKPPKWQKPRVAHPEAEFPPEWQSLCMIVDPPQRIWNRSHKLVQVSSGKAWKALMGSPCTGGDPRPWAAELTSDGELAGAWLLFCLSTGNASLLQGVAEHSPGLLQGMWKAAFPDAELSECWAKIDDSRGHRLVKIGPFGWEDHEATAVNEAVYATHFPEPGVDWCVYGVDRSTHDS